MTPGRMVSLALIVFGASLVVAAAAVWQGLALALFAGGVALIVAGIFLVDVR
jgi:hypothetical protein